MINIKNILGKNKESKILLLLVFLEHMFFFYFNNIINRDILFDSAEFYNRSLEVNLTKDISYLLYPGSRFMLFITTLFSKIFVTFTLTSLVFSLISFLPYYFLIKKYSEQIFLWKNLFLKSTVLFLLFIPSVHLWLTGIYKEAVIFPCMYFLLENIYTHKNKIFRWDNIIYGIIILFLRPYLASLILIGIIITNYQNLTKKTKIISAALLIISFIMFMIFIPYQNLSNIGNLFSALNQLSKSEGNSYIDLESVNYFERLLFMFFRPLFFDASTKAQWIYSCENTGLIIWFLLFLYTFLKKKINVFLFLKNIFILVSLSVWLFIGIYIYNYGLASRMKVMILPFFMMGILKIIQKQQWCEKNNPS